MSQGGLPIGLTIGGYHHGTTEKAGNHHRARRREVVALGVRRDACWRGAREQAHRQHATRTALQRATQPRAARRPSQAQNRLTLKPKEGAHQHQPMHPLSSIQQNRHQTETPSALVPLEQIPCVHLVGHVGQAVDPVVGRDHVALGLELGQIVRDITAEELRRVQGRLVNHHGHALGLDALHDALDGARAEVVAVRLHGQAVHADDGLLLALVDLAPHHLQHLAGDEVFAGALASTIASIKFWGTSL